MTSSNMNLGDLVILVADPSSYMSMLIHSMLRGFGSNKILEVCNSGGVLQALTGQKIDILSAMSGCLPTAGFPSPALFAAKRITRTGQYRF